jgi:hypothetical protein
MTQLERLRAAAAKHDLQEVRAILDESQNAPPLGASDGTIPAHVWEAAQASSERLSSLQGALKRLQDTERRFAQGWSSQDPRNVVQGKAKIVIAATDSFRRTTDAFIAELEYDGAIVLTDKNMSAGEEWPSRWLWTLAP